jgi:hypothetical protein
MVKPEPAGYLALAESFRQEGVFLEQALALSEGHHQFPDDERLASNLLITYLGTTLTDSVNRLAMPLSISASYAAQTNVRAAAAQGKWESSLPLSQAGAVANWYLGATPKPDYTDLLKKVSDTTTAQSLHGYMALFNGLVLAEKSNISLKKVDTLLETLQGGFREDMLYARAWALWRRGNRLQALEDMLTLANPSSLSAGTYYTTATLWAHDLDNRPLANKIASDGKEKVHASLHSLLSPDSTLMDGPPARLTEDQRVKWAWAKSGSLSPEAIANLGGDFQSPALSRAFVWAAAKRNQSPAAVWKMALAALKPADDSISVGLDNALAWGAAEAFLADDLALDRGLPPRYLSLLGSWGNEQSKSGSASTPTGLRDLVEAFPFSPTIWNLALNKAGDSQTLLQPLFEVAARAYALDKENLFLKQTYIGLARSLNLDFFADEAEKE